MPAAPVPRQATAVDVRDGLRSRSEVIARYRQLRRISKVHSTEAADRVSPALFLQQARRLGLVAGNTIVLDDMDALTFVQDLVNYTAPAGRSRAIDRYAKAARLAPESDEAVVLDAMCRARFVIGEVVRRHEAAGLILRDVARGEEVWLMDEGMEKSMPDGALLATRMYAPESFFMTAGLFVPLDDRQLLNDAFAEVPYLLRKAPAAAVDDRRFAEALYRVALADGLMERMAWQDPTDDPPA